MTSWTCGARSPIPAATGAPPRSASPPIIPPLARPPRLVSTRLRLLGLQASLHELLAGALGDVHPGIALLVPLGRTRAGRIGRLAVVLGCPRDGKALFVLELRDRRRAGLRAGEQRHGECGGDGGRDEHTGRLHVVCPPGYGWMGVSDRGRLNSVL